MKTITVDEFLCKCKPCYGEDRVREIAAGKKDWSALDIARLTGILARDRLWALSYSGLINRDDVTRLLLPYISQFILKYNKSPNSFSSFLKHEFIELFFAEAARDKYEIKTIFNEISDFASHFPNLEQRAYAEKFLKSCLQHLINGASSHMFNAIESFINIDYFWIPEFEDSSNEDYEIALHRYLSIVLEHNSLDNTNNLIQNLRLPRADSAKIEMVKKSTVKKFIETKEACDNYGQEFEEALREYSEIKGVNRNDAYAEIHEAVRLQK
ncbi:MAG: hypothetical protein LBK23_04620 [Oscillospiraceae bacterium]|jgi:hypothetical protein|nr:hypothetical protein [Oscillospiraceae bacterium]